VLDTMEAKARCFMTGREATAIVQASDARRGGLPDLDHCSECWNRAEACEDCAGEVGACPECGRDADAHDRREDAKECEFVALACVHGIRAGFECDRCGVDQGRL
jgi:hypothetical protein